MAYPRTLILCTLGSLFIYACTIDTVLDVLNLEDESTFVVICQVISSILYVCSAIPLIAITYLHNQGPYHISNRNARPILLQWLGFSFLLCSLFPINYIAQEKNEYQMGSWLFQKQAGFIYQHSPWLKNQQNPFQVPFFFQIHQKFVRKSVHFLIKFLKTE